jgi:hypothetical protein
MAVAAGFKSGTLAIDVCLSFSLVSPSSFLRDISVSTKYRQAIRQFPKGIPPMVETPLENPFSQGNSLVFLETLV